LLSVRAIAGRSGAVARCAVVVGALLVCGLRAEESVDSASGLVRAQALAIQAVAEQKAQRFDAARELYRQVLDLDPGNAQARAGLAEVSAVLAGRGDAVATDHLALRQQVGIAEAAAALGEAELLIQSGRFPEARERLVIAGNHLRPWAGEAAVEEQRQRLVSLEAEAQRLDALARTAATGVERVDRRLGAERAADQERRRQRSILDERLARIRDLERRKLIELALATCRRLVSDYPGEPEVEAQFNRLLAATHEQRRLDYAEQIKERKHEVMARLERSMIPSGFDGLPIYPSDWPERHSGRTNPLDAPRQLPPWHEALLDRLAQRVTVSFEAIDLSEALNFLAKQGGFNLVVDPAIAAGQRQVTFKVTDMQVEHALDWICRLGDTAWSITKGAIYIGKDAAETPVLGIYEVTQLTNALPDQAGYSLAYQATGGMGGMAGGGFNLFNTANQAAAGKAPTPEDLIDLIKKSVSPATWTRPENTIAVRSNRLFVNAPDSAHILIAEFLRSQVNQRHLLVHVDARWLTILDSFLEEIGVDWGAALNLITVNPFDPNSIARAPGLGSVNGTSSADGRVISTLPGTAVTVDPATLGSGLTLSAIRLGGTTLSAVLTAVERKQQAFDLAHPVVVTVNGVRGSCFYGFQYAYISGYGGNGGTLDPTISVLNFGAALDVKPYVSADRKYVTMEFRQVLVDFIGSVIENIIGIIDLGNAGNGVNIFALVNNPIELPSIKVDEIATSIIVPDKGSLLVGGFNGTIDQELSTKVPFLGHIPFLGRLFGRRGRYSQRERLYILATVNIINYEEAETKL